MKCSPTANLWLRVVCACAVVCAGLPRRASAGERFGLESVGGRFGVPTSASGAGFKQAEGFADFRLPWRWELGREWHIEPRLDSSLGWLGDVHSSSLLVGAGPTFVLGWRHFPLTLEGGVSPSYLSRDHFATKDLGFPLEFATRAGLNWDFVPHFRVFYRFEHISNAGLSGDNPGLNMNLVGLSYVF